MRSLRIWTEEEMSDWEGLSREVEGKLEPKLFTHRKVFRKKIIWTLPSAAESSKSIKNKTSSIGFVDNITNDLSRGHFNWEYEEMDKAIFYHKFDNKELRVAGGESGIEELFLNRWRRSKNIQFLMRRIWQPEREKDMEREREIHEREVVNGSVSCVGTPFSLKGSSV